MPSYPPPKQSKIISACMLYRITLERVNWRIEISKSVMMMRSHSNGG
jgi:hypothetical protein